MNYWYATLEEAKKTALLWNGDPQTVEHLENFSAAVFKFSTFSGETGILRFIDTSQRTYEQILGEIDFLEFIKSEDQFLNIGNANSTFKNKNVFGHKSNNKSSAENLIAYYPIATKDGTLALKFQGVNGPMTCSVFKYIEGIELREGSPYLTDELYLKWGRNLAAIHQASRNYQPKNIRRWQWDEEHLIKNALTLIPSEDTKSRDQFLEIMRRCQALEKNDSNFGMIHADHAPQNFIFNPVTDEITAIDFGNCCYHWYLADLAISLSVNRRKENKEKIKSLILSGYCETESLPGNYEELLDLFIKLRVLYVYLDRLFRFGPIPTADERKLLLTLKERVHSNEGWEIISQ
ncbi:MAG: phosphotransferase [Bdellovibrionota bacterium]